MSEQRLRERLQSRGVRQDAEEVAVGTLTEAGFVDDGRLARGRAVALAERGWGDAAIGARLTGEGLRAPEVEAAVAELEPETDRAGALAAGLPRQKAWSLSSAPRVRLRDDRVRPGRPGRERRRGARIVLHHHTQKKPARNGFSFESGNLRPVTFRSPVP